MNQRWWNTARCAATRAFTVIMRNFGIVEASHTPLPRNGHVPYGTIGNSPALRASGAATAGNYDPRSQVPKGRLVSRTNDRHAFHPQNLLATLRGISNCGPTARPSPIIHLSTNPSIHHADALTKSNNHRHVASRFRAPGGGGKGRVGIFTALPRYALARRLKARPCSLI